MTRPTGSRYRWWHAAAVGGLANLASSLPTGYHGDEEYYASLRLPPGAPPVMWSVWPLT